MAVVPCEAEATIEEQVLTVTPVSRRNYTLLPDRIHVEFSVRTGEATVGTKDWHYTDTQTRKRFPSRKEVLRFLEKENQPGFSTSTASPTTSSMTSEEIAAVARAWEPESITWVVEKLNSGDPPIPYVNGVRVPEEIREVWAEDFDRELNKSKSKKRKRRRKQSNFREEKIHEGFV